MLSFLNIFFFAFHSAVILFNLFGWMWRPTRKANLVVLSLTGLSWFGLGIFYGWGYCLCTDWHWQVRAKLGYVTDANSYVKFLVDSATGWNVNAGLVDAATLILFLGALAASITLNVRSSTVNVRSSSSRPSSGNDSGSAPSESSDDGTPAP